MQSSLDRKRMYRILYRLCTPLARRCLAGCRRNFRRQTSAGSTAFPPRLGYLLVLIARDLIIIKNMSLARRSPSDAAEPRALLRKKNTLAMTTVVGTRLFGARLVERRHPIDQDVLDLIKESNGPVALQVIACKHHGLQIVCSIDITLPGHAICVGRIVKSIENECIGYCTGYVLR